MTDYLEIEGGQVLGGVVQVSGAKNAVLPMLVAALLSAEPCRFRNVPRIADVELTLSLLRQFGAVVERQSNEIQVAVPQLLAQEASYSLVKAMRSSFWVLGPLLARGGAARVALPGGDIIGARPVDIHLAALSKMGADIKVRQGLVLASAPQGLKAAEIELRFPSVGATHQILLAAALTKGRTIIKNAAKEPEVTALAELLAAMGCDVEGAGTGEVAIRGAAELGGAEVSLIGDRIEAATWALAAAVSGGQLRITGFDPAHFGLFWDLLVEMGLDLETGPDFMVVKGGARLQAVEVATAPFPGLATDIQAPLLAALCLAEGRSVIEENIFEGRFGHVAELCRLGADITVVEHQAVVRGVAKLQGAPVTAYDIRGAAALVVAALAAEGHTQIYEPQHLRRGYEDLEPKLRSVGARVGWRIEDPEDYFFSGC